MVLLTDWPMKLMLCVRSPYTYGATFLLIEYNLVIMSFVRL